RPSPRWTRPASSICRPIGTKGLSEVIGFWKTMPTFRPIVLARCRGGSAERSCPSSSILPLIRMPRGAMPMMALISIDLPAPDSPTMPSARRVSRLKSISCRICRGPDASLISQLMALHERRGRAVAVVSISALPLTVVEALGEIIADRVEGIDGQHDGEHGPDDEDGEAA